jgi:hypothetical protein
MPILDVQIEHETKPGESSQLSQLGDTKSDESVKKCMDCYLRSQAIKVERGIQCRRLKLQSKGTQTSPKSWL